MSLITWSSFGCAARAFRLEGLGLSSQAGPGMSVHFRRPKDMSLPEYSLKDGSVIKIRGPLAEKFLYVFDPLALHHILVKDQHFYEPSEDTSQATRLIVGDGLIGTTGDIHRKQRKMLNPVFSAAHMRDMVPLFYSITHKLEHAFSLRVKNGPHEIDVLSWAARTALELIAQSGLGTSFDPLTEDAVPHPYASAAKRLIIVIAQTNLLRIYVLPIVMKIGTPKFRRAVLEWLPSKTLQEARETVDVLHNTSVEIYQTKKALSEGEGPFRDHFAQSKDIISILMRENLTAAKGEGLSENEVIGQMSTLAFAATDTTSAAISRTLWALTQHQDVQEKLRAELSVAMSDRETLSYDDLVGLTYLDAVCREVLRLYAPVPLIMRTAREDTILPLNNPLTGVDGRVLHEVVVPKGTNILINVFNCNRNPVIWGPDSDEFKPDRWLNPLPETITNARIPGVYSNLMTFGGGGRSCIGFKFSQLEMKVVLSVLVHKFKFTAPKDKEIYWNMTSPVASPCVVEAGESSPPRLPLVVEEAKPSWN